MHRRQKQWPQEATTASSKTSPHKPQGAGSPARVPRRPVLTCPPQPPHTSAPLGLHLGPYFAAIFLRLLAAISAELFAGLKPQRKPSQSPSLLSIGSNKPRKRGARERIPPKREMKQFKNSKMVDQRTYARQYAQKGPKMPKDGQKNAQRMTA